MINVMVDIETLGVGKNPVILQIGIVLFNEKFQHIGHLNLHVDTVESILEGYEVESGAVKFWKDQGSGLRDSVIATSANDISGMTPQHAAASINRFLGKNVKGDFTIWANGILFDIPKIDNLLEKFGYKSLTDRTRYNLVYDTRTLYSAAKQINLEAFEHAKSLCNSDGNAHNALADCAWQIGMLSATMSILSGSYEILPSIVESNSEPTSDQKVLTEDVEHTDDDSNDDFLAHVYGG